MYENLYYSQTIAAHENRERERAAERRRFIAEHADQIVPRGPGLFRRMLRRLAAAAGRAPRAEAARTVCGEPTAVAAR